MTPSSHRPDAGDREFERRGDCEVKEAGARSVTLVCLVSAPEGIERVHSGIPTSGSSRRRSILELNERGYIVPGLGDAGDRLYGTK